MRAPEKCVRFKSSAGGTKRKVYFYKFICSRICFFPPFSCNAPIVPVSFGDTAALVTEGDNIGLFLTEIKPVACPYVLPTPSVLLQTAWLRSSQRMGQCPLIWSQQPSCPGQVSVRPGAVPSMPWLVPDWIPPSNPFQRLFFFLWIRYAVWFSFPFVMCRVKGELDWL